ncbi:ASKHA domain-containing protein [Methanoregula sp.]|jgi:uncharacterized 2Fe-2S/4Fe-4S cluster protein (DUF4445 family)|uniref:ASKHA domain-containing protein n=1 Tax=Methanoregula sp. TaxID=2052170 RepID=UPI003C2548CA
MADLIRVLFHPMEKDALVTGRTTVLEAIRSAGIQVESICGGKGECNKCRVIHVLGDCDAGSPESLKGLTPEEISRHYCRACQTHVLGPCEFIIPVESRIDSPKILLTYVGGSRDLSLSVTKHLLVTAPAGYESSGQRSLKLADYTGPRPHMTREQHDLMAGSTEPMTVTITRSTGYPEVMKIEPGDTTGRNYGLAVDLGTTTVVGLLVNLLTGEACGEASALNRQITYGEELLTRIAAAKRPGGRAQLQLAATESINAVISQLVSAAGIQQDEINDVCVAGNTVMHYLLLGYEPGILEIANADIPRTPSVVKARTLGLRVHKEACVWCLPDVSRFIGGDAVGDTVASGMYASHELSLVVDLGTNGEVILGNAEWMASVSCASGPAFEGAGISSGLRAMKGAIDHVTIDPDTGNVSWTTIGNEPPKGICGSGIIDAAAAMVGAGILDFTGKLVDGRPGVRQRAGNETGTGDDGLEFVLVGKGQTATGRDIVITRDDMAYLMDSKAAVCGSIGVLLNKYRVRVGDVRHVYLAGAFGAYADTAKIVKFGIIPDFFQATFHQIGNGSLSGAAAVLVSRMKRQDAQNVARKMVYIDLLVDADFIEEYASALYIPGRPEYFPR